MTILKKPYLGFERSEAADEQDVGKVRMRMMIHSLKRTKQVRPRL
jgi:hypothetical protein